MDSHGFAAPRWLRNRHLMTVTANLARLPKDKDVIVYCDTGQQQNKAVTALRLLGYKAYAMKWGYMAWKVAPPTGSTLDEISAAIANDYPVEK